jgi:molybdenum cofactor cytidylyltransferase
MARAPSFAGVILAAGESSRMGRDKAFLAWQGKTFLEAAILSLQPATELVIVVAGTNAEGVKPIAYAAGARAVVNPHPQRGQFSSLQVGLQEVLNTGRDAAIVTLVDRPPAEQSTISRLRNEFLEQCLRGAWTVVPSFEQKHGHPIVIGREMIEAFLRAPASTTAREVEHAHQNRIRYVVVDDPHVTMNVDTAADYDQLT